MTASEDYPDFPEARRRGLIPAPKPAPTDLIADLIEKADHAEPSQGLVFAQMATVLAIREQTEELRITNKILSEVGL